MLSRQRYHDSCRSSPNSPLKVRKTRENLKQNLLAADIPPPNCRRPPWHECTSSDAATATVGGTAEPASHNRARRHAGDDHLCMTIACATSHLQEDNGVQSLPLPSPATLAAPIVSENGAQRQKSVSRRVLSKVRAGLSNRSKSSQSIRPRDSDAQVSRQPSSKLNAACTTNHGDVRARSFDICRQSVTESDLSISSVTSLAEPQYSSLQPRTPLIYTMGSRTTETPNPARRRASPRRMTGPASESSSDPEPTPRAPVRDETHALAELRQLSATAPHLSLKVRPSSGSIDVADAQDIWVAVEATVHMSIVNAEGTDSCESGLVLSQPPMDIIVLVSADMAYGADVIARRCLLEIVKRLDVPGDRLAILQIYSENDHDATYVQLHPLQRPDPALLAAKLNLFIQGDNQSTVPGNSFPLSRLHSDLRGQGLKLDRVQSLIVSKQQNTLVEQVMCTANWPVHQIRVGVQSEGPTTLSRRQPPSNWFIEVPRPEDVDPEILRDLMRDVRNGCSLGSITSLRLCYRPMSGCHIKEVVGQKALRDAQPGQTCALYLNVHIPRVQSTSIASSAATKEELENTDPDVLLTELESIVGTLETEILHVEARYRHSALPVDNIVTIRHVCSVARPKTDSRWTLAMPSLQLNDVARSAAYVHGRLAQFIARYYAPHRALKVIDRWIPRAAATAETVQDVRRYLEDLVRKQRHDSPLGSEGTGFAELPVFLDEVEGSTSSPGCMSMLSATPSMASILSGPKPATWQTSTQFAPSLSLSPPALTPRSTSAPRLTMASLQTKDLPAVPKSSTSAESSPTDGVDSARQVWQHIRRSSRSSKQLLELAAERVQDIESRDEHLRALRQRAFANKRSIGAETLKSWQWDEKTKTNRGEAPWL